MWCKRGEVFVAWRFVVQSHHLKLLWPYVRTCMRGIHDGNMTGHPIVHMHILHISKEEVSHKTEGGKPSRRLKVTPKKANEHSSPK